MNKSRILLLVVVLLIAGPAAAFTFDDCNGNTDAGMYSITGYELTCIAITNADSTNDTAAFNIRAKSAVICFDPALDDDGTEIGQVKVRHCASGKLPSATPELECTVRYATLTGAVGSNQLSCVDVTPGLYYIEVTTAMGAGNTGRVTIQGGGE